MLQQALMQEELNALTVNIVKIERREQLTTLPAMTIPV